MGMLYGMSADGLLWCWGRVMASRDVFESFDILNHWFQRFYFEQRLVPATLDNEFIRLGIQKVLESEHGICTAKVLWFLYKNFPVFPPQLKRKISDMLFDQNLFVSLFLHWSDIVRYTFYSLVWYRAMGFIKLGNHVSKATVQNTSKSINAHLIISEYISNKMKSDNDKGKHKNFVSNYRRSDLLLLLDLMKRQLAEYELEQLNPRENRKSLLKKRKNAQTPTKKQPSILPTENSIKAEGSFKAFPEQEKDRETTDSLRLNRFSSLNFLDLDFIGKKTESSERMTFEGLNLASAEGMSQVKRNEDLILLQSFMNLQREGATHLIPNVLKLRGRVYSENLGEAGPDETQRNLDEGKDQRKKNLGLKRSGRKKSHIMTTIHKRNSTILD